MVFMLIFQNYTRTSDTKGKRAGSATYLAGDILASDPKNVANGEKQKEDDGKSESKKRKRAIAARINRPLKFTSRNKDKEDKDKEEDFHSPLYSTEEGSPGNEEDKGSEDNRIYDREDIMLYKTKENKEEASLAHKGDSLSLLFVGEFIRQR